MFGLIVIPPPSIVFADSNEAAIYPLAFSPTYEVVMLVVVAIFIYLKSLL